MVEGMLLGGENLPGVQNRGQNANLTIFFGFFDMNEAHSETLFQRFIILIEFEAPVGQEAQQRVDD